MSAVSIVQAVSSSSARPPPATGEERWFLVGFLKLDSYSRKRWMNRLASWWSGSDIFHAELYFPEQDGGLFGLTQHQPAMFMHQDHSRIEHFGERWQWIAVRVSETRYQHLLEWCRARERQQTQFDWRGYFCVCLPGMLDMRGNSYMCSGLIAKALVESGVITPGVSNAASISPSALREYLFRQQGLETRVMDTFAQGKHCVENFESAQPAGPGQRKSKTRPVDSVQTSGKSEASAELPARTTVQYPSHHNNNTPHETVLKMKLQKSRQHRTLKIQSTQPPCRQDVDLFAEALRQALYADTN